MESSLTPPTERTPVESLTNGEKAINALERTDVFAWCLWLSLGNISHAFPVKLSQKSSIKPGQVLTESDVSHSGCLLARGWLACCVVNTIFLHVLVSTWALLVSGFGSWVETRPVVLPPGAPLE
mgnify:CR=1 FL=1